MYCTFGYWVKTAYTIHLLSVCSVLAATLLEVLVCQQFTRVPHTEQNKKKKRKIWNTEEKRAAERKKLCCWVLCGLPCDVVISPETTITERELNIYAGILTFLLLLLLLFSGERRAQTSRGEFGLAFLEKPILTERYRKKRAPFFGSTSVYCTIRTISSKVSNKPEEEEEEEMIFFPSQVWSPLLSI